MSDKPKMSEEELIVFGIEQLFSKHFCLDNEEELVKMSNYFDALSKRINSEKLTVDISQDLLKSFNAVVLVLKDRLALYPEKFQIEVLEVLRKSDLERIFDVISVVSPDQLAQMLHPPLSLVRGVLDGFGKHTPDPRSITSSNLFDAKLALNKLAQFAKYLSQIEVNNYEPEWNELADHYNPNLLDKRRILALVSRLRADILALDDSHVQRRLQGYVEKLEAEIGKAKPRWGRIIAGFFVVLSFVADLRTVFPDAYNSIYHDVVEILSVIVHESGVERQRRGPALPQDSHHASVFLLPDPPKVKRED